LEERVTDQLKRQKVWPKNARSMSGHLKRLSPNLRAGGWQVTFHREARQRLVVIERAEVCASPPELASSPDGDGTMQSDAERGDLFPNDERDVHDAGAGPADPSRDSNADAWDEGEL
jgi:hypothetical protein